MRLQYFTEKEFERNGRNWYKDMSPELLMKLDLFRFQTGRCIISPHPDAIGRNLGDATSRHNIDRYGEVQAIDVFPTYIWEGALSMRSAVQMTVDAATTLGFTGIGIYADTQLDGIPFIMMHLDVRDSNPLGNPATWGRVEGDFTSLEETLNWIEEFWNS